MNSSSMLSDKALAAATTLTALMEANRTHPGLLTYLEGEREQRRVSYPELYERALGILHHLQRLGAQPGDHLILFLSSNEPFIDAFWAALLGGIIPVPIAPGISDEHRHKLLRIARKLQRPYLYSEQRLLERIGSFAAEHQQQALFESLRARSFVVDELTELTRSGKPYRARADDVAFIQFSSGSTSEPKGVVLTHANLIANIRGTTEKARLSQQDVSLSWMPLTHDMGLIGFHLMLFANRAHAHLMPTELFVRRPLLWLQLAARVHATLLCSPNFGYRHYLKVLGERSPGELDLSAVRLIFNGAEPISAELCAEFLQRLAGTGLAAGAMFPVYGLAEAALAVSFPAPGAPYHSAHFSRTALGVGAQARLLSAGERDALSLVSVGTPVPYCEVRLVDDAERVLAAQQVGHLQIRGANVTRGYYEDAAANAASFSTDGWLRTGDLGLWHQGELYITGRFKEILFVHGQNYYPHDLERLLQHLPGLELGKVVVAGVRPSGASEEQLAVFVLHRGEIADFAPIVRQIAHILGEHAGLEVGVVVPVKRIPKTTSGKIQRHLLEQEYLAGAFDAELEALRPLQAPSAAAGPPAGSAIEQQLRAICEEVLDGRSIDVDESLFDIGASSISLLAIHERIEQRWPRQVDVTDIFDHPSIRALARFLEQKLAGTA